MKKLFLSGVAALFLVTGDGTRYRGWMRGSVENTRRVFERTSRTEDGISDPQAI